MVVLPVDRTDRSHRHAEAQGVYRQRDCRSDHPVCLLDRHGAPQRVHGQRRLVGRAPDGQREVDRARGIRHRLERTPELDDLTNLESDPSVENHRGTPALRR